MEKSEGYLKVGIKINDLELQLSLYDEAVKECDETGKRREQEVVDNSNNNNLTL